MISLQDEIQKFQKLVYNSELQQFVTVDQMFVGGGITMESVIRQSNFVVQELKKMNSVFKNYCKLNDKVYQKITEHQLSVHSQQAKLNMMVGTVDRKLQTATKKINEIHEDTLVQNRKSHQALMENLEPIRKELEEKVDQATFSAMVKKFLEDNQDQEVSKEDEELNQGRGQTATAGVLYAQEPNSPYPKKKGKLSFDEFYRFRDELDAKLKASDEQRQSISTEGDQTKNLLLKYIPQINNLSSTLKQTETSIYKLEISQKDSSETLSKDIIKLSLDLNTRLNDEVWSSKFEGYHDKKIKPIVKKLEESLKSHQIEIKRNQEENIMKFKQIDADLIKNMSEITISKREISKLKEEQPIIKQLITSNKKETDQQLFTISKNIQMLSQESKKALTALQNKLQKDVKELKKSLDQIVQTVEQSVLKVVNKKFDFQLKQIDKNIRQNSENIKQARIDLGLVQEQLKNMKNILSQKANFSDIVQHVEKKADKQDFKELQTKMHENSQQYLSNHLNESMNMMNLSRAQKTEGGSTKKIPSINKISNNSKTLIMPQTPHRSERLNMDSGTKMFMCGMDGHIETRKSWTQSSRRRNQKSSAAIVGDFFA